MDLQRLKKLYPSMVEFSKKKKDTLPDFNWYQFQNKIIGIAKQELTERDKMLLDTFLTPYYSQLPAQTIKEKKWEGRIQERNDQNLGRDGRYRFIFFKIEKGPFDATIFKETLQAFFRSDVSILWNTSNEGFIIEEPNSFLEEDLTYHHIADTLMSELYVKIMLFIGPYLENDKELDDYIQQLTQMAELSFRKTDTSVIDYTEVYPFFLIETLSPKQREQLSEWILKEFSTDSEALETIRMFIQCNLNASETAKKLYIHRNSLQYRLDKFYESTGIDVKQFDKAFTVYLAILANMHNR
ncbi:PucR family transcriptional regulator [Oceanobacillus jeddahense]|uniref:Helix-turn-helix domain-containing protein n=1 Tax=Oceanobacillus jeddahense TaxID=1462527 RepID=A0ABY5JXN6_9BACI|nr:helix-turn-helix domain-containing protein [Oceanobacillus jeddahense]UUI05150.1 helix-turn-helix domain-containing protein [Oceanobacillus jeddahense]